MTENPEFGSPAARHLSEPALWARMTIPKAGSPSPSSSGQSNEGSKPQSPSPERPLKPDRTRQTSLKKKRFIAMLITILVVLAIPTLFVMLVLAG